MEIVNTVTTDEEMLAAALLHDTIEDTDTTKADIEQAFGPEVATLVDELTDISKPEDGNRATRKAMDRAKLANVSARAQTIKLADLIHNSKDIARNDEKFAKVYMKEKAALLDVLVKGDARLMEIARNILEQYQESQ